MGFNCSLTSRILGIAAPHREQFVRHDERIGTMPCTSPRISPDISPLTTGSGLRSGPAAMHAWHRRIVGISPGIMKLTSGEHIQPFLPCHSPTHRPPPACELPSTPTPFLDIKQRGNIQPYRTVAPGIVPSLEGLIATWLRPLLPSRERNPFHQSSWRTLLEWDMQKRLPPGCFPMNSDI